MPVDVVDFALAPQPRSRAIRDFKRIPHPNRDRSGFLGEIRDFIQRGGHDTVIPTDDQNLVAVTDHYHDLNDLAVIASPPPETTGLVLNKTSTLEVAQKCGLATPKTKVITSSPQLFEQLSSFPFPCVLKPATKKVQVEDTKSYLFVSPQEVQARFPRSREFATPMLLQEYCPGDGVGVEILMHEGSPVAIFQHRRLKELPYTGGVSVTAIAEKPDPMLAEKSLAVLRALQWEGPAMVEFKVSASHRSPVFMEVNGRYWGTIGLAIAAGINFPLYQWQLLHGEMPAAPTEYAVGIKWVWTAGHMARMNGLLVQARISAGARNELFRSLADFPGLIRDSASHSLFDPTDPMPALLHALDMIRFLVRQDVNGLLKRFRSNRQVA